MRLALVLLLSLTLAAEEPRPTFTCGIRSKINRGRFGTVARILCTSRHTNGIPEWRLFGADEDMLTDFDTSRQFEFVAPDEWRLLEMRAVDAEGTEVRARVWVRVYSGQVEWAKYGNE